MNRRQLLKSLTLGGVILAVGGRSASPNDYSTAFTFFAWTVMILGGVGSLAGAFVGSFITGFVYTFGVALFPQLAYVVLFLPMIFVIAFRPRGLFGKFAA